MEVHNVKLLPKGLLEIEASRVQEITQLHNEIGGYLKLSLEKAIRIGELLVQQKASMKHGGFISWVKTNLPFTDRTARNYMGLYRERDRLKTERVSDLTEGYNLLSAPIIELKKEQREAHRRKDRERIEYAREHPEECPVGEASYGKAGAGWDCRFTIVDQFAGLPMTHCECIDPEYWRLKEGEASSSLYDKLRHIIYGIKGIEKIEQDITKCLAKDKDVIDSAYWVDWDCGVRSMSPSLAQALAEVGAKLGAVIREFNEKQAPAIEKFAPPAKGSGQPRHGWITWGLEA